MRENERCPACGNRPGELPSCGRCGEPKEPCCLWMAGGTMCSCPKEYELSDVRMVLHTPEGDVELTGFAEDAGIEFEP